VNDTDEGPRTVDLDLAALEEAARRKIGEMAYAYYAGGAEDEQQLAENVAAWRRWRLRPHVLADVSTVSTATTVLGSPVALPVIVAPTALHAHADPDGEVATARAAGRAGACFVLSCLATRELAEVAEGPGVRWMQVYVLKDRAKTVDMVQRAAAAGYQALVLTVDAPVSGLRRRELRANVALPPGFALPNLADPEDAWRLGRGFMAAVLGAFDPTLTFADISWLSEVSGLPVVVKGVVRGDDALRCVEAGARAVDVSNHGGRQLNDGLATVDALAEVVDAVAGRAEVYVDGGLRRGADVVKAISIGATAVMVGRPVLWALSAGGTDGVVALLEWFGDEVRRTMALCGVTTIGALDRSLVARAP
jgi:4-hydroxymandelate oxidase